MRKMGEYKVMDGNDAAAYGVMLSRPDVIAIFPITPNTTLINGIAEMTAQGKITAKNVTVENEHSALSVVIGASAAGARTFTASASQGVVFMEEVLWMTPGYRLPVVMAICNRSVAFPGGLQCTHSDSLLQRDNGWLQLYCEDAQEVIDTTIQSYRIAEDKRVLLPTHFMLDGYVLSACAVPVDIPDQDEVDDFLPPYKPDHFYLETPRSRRTWIRVSPLTAGLRPRSGTRSTRRYRTRRTSSGRFTTSTQSGSAGATATASSRSTDARTRGQS
jgi:pyruvate ferredoxin oxidoreductase alpha subunit